MEEYDMLVLTRKTDESIFIDGDIEVMVVSVRGSKVRLGFRAPANVSIQRKERLEQLGLVEAGAAADVSRPNSDFLPFGAGQAPARPR
jgi:carbon storage regulator